MNQIVSVNGVLDVRGAYRYIAEQREFPFDALDVECDLDGVLAFFDLKPRFHTRAERYALQRQLVHHARREAERRSRSRSLFWSSGLEREGE